MRGFGRGCYYVAAWPPQLQMETRPASDILAEGLFDDQLLADFPPGRKEELRGVGIADPQHPKPLVDKGEAFMSNLARARARQAPAILQESVAAALTARWSATLTHAATIGHPSHRSHTKSLQR